MKGEYTNEKQSAEKHFTVRMTPKAKKELVERAHAAISQGRYYDAERIYKDLILKYPHDVCYHHSLAFCYQKQKKFQFAILRFESIIKQFSEYREAYLGLARCYLEAGQFEDAIAQFKVAITRFSEYREAYLGLARCYQVGRTI